MSNRFVKIRLIEKKDNYKLLSRFYKDTLINEFLVCIGYDKKTNTYKEGLRTSNLQLAYSLFNSLVINGKLPKLDESIN